MSPLLWNRRECVASLLPDVRPGSASSVFLVVCRTEAETFGNNSVYCFLQRVLTTTHKTPSGRVNRVRNMTFFRERGFINIPHLSGQRRNVCASKTQSCVCMTELLRKDFSSGLGLFFFFSKTKTQQKFCTARCHAGVARLLLVVVSSHSLDVSVEASCFYSAVNHHRLSWWPLHSALQEQQPSDFYPVVSLSLTFMQNRNTKCWGGAETPTEGDGLSWTEGAAGGGSNPFDQLASLSPSILLHRPALFSVHAFLHLSSHSRL